MDQRFREEGQDESRLLVEAAQAGDRDAMQRLWCEHRRWLAVVLTAHAPRGADVADLLQEVAVSLVTKIETLQNPEALRPWLRQVAVNIARTAARRRRPTLRLSDPEHADAHESAQAPLLRGETRRRILEQMAQLPLKHREPLMLRAIKDMSYEQIGQVLDLPVTTIETRIARARRMLREMLMEETPPISTPMLSAAGEKP